MILLTDSSGRPYDPAFLAAASAATAGSGIGIAAAQQSPIRGSPEEQKRVEIALG